MNTCKYRIKDITFLSNGNILLAIMINNGKTCMKDYNHCDNGFIGLYDSNFRLIDKYEINEIHMDSIITDRYNNFYLTVQENEDGFIYKGNINNNMIRNIKKIKVQDFPHGIDINHEYNLLGFTSYETSSAYILSLNCI